MYFPPGFDCERAIELGRLVKQAYQQFEDYKNKKSWQLQDDYTLVGEIFYRTFLSFDPNAEESDKTAIDREMETVIEQEPVSFGLLDDLLYKDVPMGFVATKDSAAYLIFRGTVTPREWIFDANIKMQDYRLKNWGKVSDGFQNIYRRCRESFIKPLGNLSADFPLFIGGHSLGGALTLLSLPDVVHSTHFKAPVLYNFGCPRVGDADFGRAYANLSAPATFRVVNSSDLVTAIPLPVAIPALPSGYYTHVGQPVEFTIQANSLTQNHNMQTYLEVLAAHQSQQAKTSDKKGKKGLDHKDNLPV
jgi:triacylglycerol lipase